MVGTSSHLERIVQQIRLDVEKPVETLLHSKRSTALFEIAIGEAKISVMEFVANTMLRIGKSCLIICPDNQITELLRDRLNHGERVSTLAIETLDNAVQFKFTPDVTISIDKPLRDKDISRLIPSGSEQNNLNILLTAQADDSALSVYGSPLYSYSFEQAYYDEIFHHPSVHIFDVTEEQITTATANELSNILEPFVTDFLSRPGAKAIIQCINQNQAQTINDSLRSHAKDIEISLLPASVRQDDFSFYEFSINMRDEAKKVIGITSNSKVGFIEQTDLVRLYPYQDTQELIHAIEPVLINHSSTYTANIWDFGGNNESYYEIHGAVISHENNHTNPTEPQDSELPSTLTESPIIPSGDSVAAKDMLGRGRLVRILKGLIEVSGKSDGFRPFVVGLLGRWGTGKSTVIKLLKDEFKDKDMPRFIEFNAWQNEHCTNMGAAMANTVVEQLYDSKSLPERLFFSLLYNLKQDNGELLLIVRLFLFTIIATLIALLFFTEYDPTKKVAATAMLLLTSIIPTAYSYYNKPFARKLRSLAKRPDYSEHLGISQQIKRELIVLLDVYSMDKWIELKNLLFIQPAQWLLSFTNLVNDENNHDSANDAGPETSNTKFVLIVDDLDRCSDQKIMEVLESIRLLIDLDSVVAILAVDQKMLLNAVATQYRSQNRDLSPNEALIIARDFLGKIFQLTIELDIPDSLTMTNFVSSRLYHRTRISDKTQEISQKESIRTLISDARNLVEEEIAFAEAFDSKTSLFDSSYHYEEPEETELKQSDDYLTPEEEERDNFATCVGLFSVTNPRTLVRLHNTITILKGMYPRLALELSTELPKYIFLTFLMEQYNAGDTDDKKRIISMFDVGNSDLKGELSASLIGIHEHGKTLNIFSTGDTELRRMISRISKHSLPSAFSLTNN